MPPARNIHLLSDFMIPEDAARFFLPIPIKSRESGVFTTSLREAASESQA